MNAYLQDGLQSRKHFLWLASLGTGRQVFKHANILSIGSTCLEYSLLACLLDAQISGQLPGRSA